MEIFGGCSADQAPFFNLVTCSSGQVTDFAWPAIPSTPLRFLFFRIGATSMPFEGAGHAISHGSVLLFVDFAFAARLSDAITERHAKRRRASRSIGRCGVGSRTPDPRQSTSGLQ